MMTVDSAKPLPIRRHTQGGTSLLHEPYDAANTPKALRVDQTAKSPRFPHEDIVMLTPAAAGANLWKTLDRSRGQTLFCVPRFPQICTTTTTTTCFYCKKEKAQKPLALFAARAPPLYYQDGSWRKAIHRAEAKVLIIHGGPTEIIYNHFSGSEYVYCLDMSTEENFSFTVRKDVLRFLKSGLDSAK